MQKTITVILIFWIFINIQAQNSAFILPKTTLLPRDSVAKKQLLVSVNHFLLQVNNPNKDNTAVLPQYLLETSILLDEMKDMMKHEGLKNDTFYKAYLTNIIRIQDSNFLLQIKYAGIQDGVPVERANFTLIAEKKAHQYFFRSPLTYHTTTWKSKVMGNTTVYYKNNLNTSKAQDCFETTTAYDKKLGAPILPTYFYCCDNYFEVFQLIGVDYKLDVNGKSYGTLTAKENNSHLLVNGTLTSTFKVYDPHDLWHSRLHNVLSPSIINRPVDEGTAYLYGGSWGLSWKEILKRFKTYADTTKNVDWLALYNESKNFDDKAKYPLNVDFVINALIAQKIEKEKGFSSVIELLGCGKKVEGNDNYFKALEKITGISKSNFNAYVIELIKGS